MFNWAAVKKFAPTIVLVIVMLLAGGTNLLSQAMHELVGASLQEFLQSLKPHIVKLAIACIAVNLLWVCFQPAVQLVEKTLEHVGADERTRGFVNKAFRSGYWVVIGVITLSMFSTNLTVLVVGLGLLLKMPAEAFTSSFLLYSCDSLKVGEEVELLDKIPVQGKVLSVGYFATKIKVPDGIVTIPNNKVWDNLVKVKTS